MRPKLSIIDKCIMSNLVKGSHKAVESPTVLWEILLEMEVKST
jgi:hypothetical protein